MAVTDAESYLDQLVGRMVQLQQGNTSLFINVLSLNAIGLLVQDREHEYFIPWASIDHIRLADDNEVARVGTPVFRQRENHPVLEPHE